MTHQASYQRHGTSRITAKNLLLVQVLALLLAVCTPWSAQAAITFGTSTTLDSGATSYTSSWIMFDDISGDQVGDMVTADLYSFCIRIGRTTRSGYGPVYTVSTGGYTPYDGATGDLNRDGRPDMIIAGGSKVVVYYGASLPGLFSGPTAYDGGGTSINRLLYADFNRDGIKDVLCRRTSPSGFGLSLLLGKSNGTFASPVNIPTDNFVPQLETTDLNQDGRLDLVILQTTGISCMLGTASTATGFLSPKPLINVSPSTSFAIGDMDRNGTDDIAYTYRGDVQVAYSNTSDPLTFDSFRQINSQPLWMFNSVRLADYNLDGWLDLYGKCATGGTSQANEIYVVTNQGGGNFEPAMAYLSSSGVPYIRDANNDGLPDLLARDTIDSAGDIIVRQATQFERQYPRKVQLPDSPIDVSAVAAADLNNDGQDDLIAGYADSTSSWLKFTLSSDKGALTSSARLPLPNIITPQAIRDIRVCDLNDDNQKDIVIAANGVFICLANGPASFTTPTLLLQNTRPFWIEVADMDKDGHLDLAIADTMNKGSWQVGFGNGDGTFTFVGAPDSVKIDYYDQIAVADLNDDGAVDIVASDWTFRAVRIWLAIPGQRAFKAATRTQYDRQPTCIRVADINKDGRTDIILGNYGTTTTTSDPKQITVFYASGNPGQFAAPVSFGVSEFPHFAIFDIELADITNDGNLDIIVQIRENNYNIALDSLLLLPSKSTPGTFGLGICLGGEVANFTRLGYADLTGDGTSDILAMNHTELKPFILAMPASCGDRFGCFVERQYLDFLRRSSDAAGRSYYVDLLCSGKSTPEQVAASFFTSTEFGETMGFSTRCYLAIFNNNATTSYTSPLYRIPDWAGVNYWTGVVQASGKLNVIRGFTGSAEWLYRIGNRDNAGFVDFLYENIMGRFADDAGKAYWVQQLDNGRDRNEIILGFIDSAEAKEIYKNRVYAVTAYVGFLNRIADLSGFAYHTSRLNNGTPLTSLVSEFITSSEYINRLLGLGCAWPPE